MIRSFRDKETEAIFSREYAKKIPRGIQKTAYRKLVLIDAAARLEDLKVPSGNRLEKLSGNREGRYSIRINEQWRICFRWRAGDAYEAEIVDYH